MNLTEESGKPAKEKIMYFYEVKSNLVDLCDSDAYVMSEDKLNEFDLLVIDTKEHSYVTCSIVKELSRFEALSQSFEIGTYLMKKNIEEHVKSKKSAVAMNNLLIKAELKVKEIQHIEKLRKHRNDPYVNALLQEYDSLKDKSDETGIANDEVI
ncbi:hypothetical protein LK527_16945 [[Clostridium] innocuum]|uniref:hypothetical protein n=1 Tax=Clostridium innocuum TaxID=1522 RepID=UPI001E3703EE|nr:hypothetical protein [[Clostridium] innocuum]MCC2838058.1 hypothetical protein [[Clostridium] innocuum]MCR0242875.1 hypothetical protein [[Clostridium] innocuum]MCR0332476.1 hypothetical protein [[Clostridium] innocuum]MCR0533267.1 hypothetical protein [[Clostridium] innocuum]MCR0537333.1 hypothetical protein [[Clostridium] innocuum]